MSGLFRVAVAKDKFRPGVEGPQHDWRDYPAPQNHPRLSYESIELVEALERTWETDAHLVTYALKNSQGVIQQFQPRINKAGVEFVQSQGFQIGTNLLFFDVDNIEHARWTTALETEAFARYRRWREAGLLKSGIYHTSNGARFIQPLTERITLDRIESQLRAFYNQFVAMGVNVDESCLDWTRHFRLPNVVRDKKKYRSSFVDLTTDMAPADLLPDAEILEELQKPRSRSARKVRGVVPDEWIASTPDEWNSRTDYIVEAIRRHAEIRSGHEVSLLLAGSLCKLKVEPSLIPHLVWDISHKVGFTEADNNRRGAERTVQRFQDGYPNAGIYQLELKYPHIRLAIVKAVNKKLNKIEPQDPVKMRTMLDAVRAAIAGAQDKVVCIATETGLGKTRALIDAALERAALGLKTGISVPTNELAIQVFNDLRDRQGLTGRIFGPISIEPPDPRACIHRKKALPLVNGGQSLQKEFCFGRNKNKCEIFSTCKVRKGIEGDEGALIYVSNHALLGQLINQIGQKGLLGVDEPPRTVTSDVIEYEDWAAFFLAYAGFHNDYAAGMRSVIDAARSWRQTGFTDAARVFDNIQPLGAHMYPTGWIGTNPPLRSHRVNAIKQSFGPDGKVEGVASRICKLLYEVAAGAVGEEKSFMDLDVDQILTDKTNEFDFDVPDPNDTLSRKVVVQYVPRPDKEAGQGDFVVTRLDRGLERALTRTVSQGGGTVLLDANLETHLQLYGKVLGYPLTCEKFSATDKSFIQRDHVLIPSSRSKLIPDKVIDLEEFALNHLRLLRVWIDEGDYVRPQHYGLITFKPLALALRAAQGETLKEEKWLKRWGDLDHFAETIRTLLTPEILSRLTIAWYGAIRGVNHMKDLDGIITLGDPIENIASSRDACVFLGITDGDAIDEYGVAICKDELEQAQGRLRVVHRLKPGRCLHVGKVTPGGTGWAREDVNSIVWEKDWERDRNPALENALPKIRLAGVLAGGWKPLSELTGIKIKTLEEYTRKRNPREPSIEVMEIISKYLFDKGHAPSDL